MYLRSTHMLCQRYDAINTLLDHSHANRSYVTWTMDVFFFVSLLAVAAATTVIVVAIVVSGEVEATAIGVVEAFI